ncbi:serine/threonine-protein kinase [Streptomyces sp. NPDC051773]|uniref:serine/threonine-protein kinase n=1 Tax=Streptomyces sp. NPDC051773 TaxID=3156682 RepID=UPI003412B4FF
MHGVRALRETDPRRIGPYEVRGRLGAGGMGEVYLAEARPGVLLAVKVVRGEHAEDRTFRARFRHEVRAAQTVGGAGTYTARVVDSDTETERPWMATEFVDGPNLRDAVLDGGALPERAVRVLAAALGEALVAIHARGMVHRDLKPSNILLAADGPRVIDFGIVRALEGTALTRTGAVVGSVGHVSPEQIRNGAEVGPPSDVFSLGTVLAYAAAGREPFGEGKDAVVLMRILTGDFDLSGVPNGVRPLVESCLRAEPADRPTPGEILAAAGHTTASLRQDMRAGWFTAAPGRALTEGSDAEPAGRADGPGSGHRWLPGRDSGERESGVEYVAPLTLTDVPVPEPAGEPGPAAEVAVRPPGSRRAVLRALAGGVTVAAAGAGVGGWWWLREPGSGSDPAGGKESRGASASASGTGGAVPASLAWRARIGQVVDTSGPCGALSPDGKTLYVSVEGKGVYALAADDGVVRWTAPFASEELEFLPMSPPAVAPDGTVLVVTSPGGSSPGTLWALGPDGDVRWSRDWDRLHTEVPVIAGELVLVTYGDGDGVGAGGVRAYGTDGDVVWTAPVPGGPDVAPLVVGDTAYVGGYDDRLHALAVADGSVTWQADLKSEVARPAYLFEILAVSTNDDGNILYGVDGDGRRVWTAHGRGGGYASTTVAVGDVFVAAQADMLVATGADGSSRWTYPAIGPLPTPVERAGVLYLRSGSELHAIDGEGLRLWRLTVGSQEGNGSSPVVGAGRLYTVTSAGVAAVELGA